MYKKYRKVFVFISAIVFVLAGLLFLISDGFFVSDRSSNISYGQTQCILNVQPSLQKVGLPVLVTAQGCCVSESDPFPFRGTIYASRITNPTGSAGFWSFYKTTQCGTATWQNVQNIAGTYQYGVSNSCCLFEPTYVFADFCEDECSEDERQCSGESGYQECVFNGVCWEWSEIKSCELVSVPLCGFGDCSDMELAIPNCSGAGVCGYTCQNCEGDTSCGAEDCFINPGTRPVWQCRTNKCVWVCEPDPACPIPCEKPGETRCAGNIIQTCEDCNRDGQLEWCDTQDCSVGDTTTCEYGDCSEKETAVNWRCEQDLIGGDGAECFYDCQENPICTDDCEHECSAGQTQCFDENNVQECGECDDDDCRDWCDISVCPEGDVYCGYSDPGGTSCFDNEIPNWGCYNDSCGFQCEYEPNCDCDSECPEADAFQCVPSGEYRGAYRLCGDYDKDFCLEWSDDVYHCPSPGDCEDEGCLPGQRPNWVCDEISDSCIPVCTSSGECSTDKCTDKCNLGAIQCSGSIVQTCGECDADDCRDWCDTENCADRDSRCGAYGCDINSQRPSWQCSDGGCVFLCVEDPSCGSGCDTSDCSVEGATMCADSGNIITCTDVGDNCLMWSSPQSCVGDTSCGYNGAFGDCDENQRPVWYCGQPPGQAAECKYYCEYSESCDSPDPCDECVEGQTSCVNEEKVTCEFNSSTGCWEWSQPEQCIGPIECGYGDRCAGNELSSWYCNDSISDCDYRCLPNAVCDSGNGCSDQCSYSGERRCFDGNTTQICESAICETDGTYYLRWSSPESCGEPICGGGNCSIEEMPDYYCLGGYCFSDCVKDSSCCEDECFYEGELECSDRTHKRTCGYYDRDDCLDWSTERLCQGSEECGYSDGYTTCLENERPSWYCSLDGCTFECIEDETCEEPPRPCEPDCSLGEIDCFDKSNELLCGFYDRDPCLDWSDPRFCEGNVSCGFEDCNENERPVWQCLSGIGCDYVCVEDEECIEEPPVECTSECPERWLARCVDSERGQVCGIYWNDDLCLEWGPPTFCSGDTYCGYENCGDYEMPSWYCDVATDTCQYICLEDENCVSDYVQNFRKDCYDNDVYWFDSEGERQEKAEECDDDNPDTIDGCENGKCYHRSEEEEYCRTQEHCGDGICNCEEDIYICFEDCEFTNLRIEIFGRKESEKEWKKEVFINRRDDLEILFNIINNSPDDFDNIIIKAQLPLEVIYKEGLKVGDISIKEDIREGINIGFLAANAKRQIIFKTEISSDAPVGIESQIIGILEVEDIYESDSLDITIERAKMGFWEVIKWLLTRWWLWLLLWILFIIILFLILRRREEDEEDEEGEEFIEGLDDSEKKTKKPAKKSEDILEEKDKAGRIELDI